jgi:hypothetical protein
VSWDICENSGLPQDQCDCIDCFPWFHRFKWVCAEAENINDIIRLLQEQVNYFKELRGRGYQIDEPQDDYMLIIPPYREGHYWARCKTCRVVYEEVLGESQRQCIRCREGLD